MSWRRDSATIAGGIAAALGKGLLIGTAGLLIAAAFGAPQAAASAWTILATGLFGSTCLLAAAVIRREQCNEDDAAKQEVRELMSLVRRLPGMGELAPDKTADEREPFTVRLDRERSESATHAKAR